MSEVIKTIEAEISALRKHFRVHYMDISHNPEIESNPVGAFNQFKEYYGKQWYLIERMLFHQKNPTINERIIKDALSVIDKWIEEAERLPANDFITSNGNIREQENYQLEYLRLKYGFYENYQMTNIQHMDNSIAAVIYGRYFLFRDWLNSQVHAKENAETIQIKNRTSKYDFVFESDILGDEFIGLLRAHDLIEEESNGDNGLWKGSKKELNILLNHLTNCRYRKGSQLDESRKILFAKNILKMNLGRSPSGFDRLTQDYETVSDNIRNFIITLSIGK